MNKGAAMDSQLKKDYAEDCPFCIGGYKSKLTTTGEDIMEPCVYCQSTGKILFISADPTVSD